MARNPVTVLKLTTMNSSVPGNPTMAAVSTGTGIYIDCSNIDASKMILVVTRTASGTNAASAANITIEDGDSKQGFSAYKLGDLKIALSSIPHSTKPTAVELNCQFIGPFETARFKDSDGHIKVNCTNATNISAIGAILI